LSRAAFVPCSDPFVSLLFSKLFKEVWQDEVDKLYVCYNSDIDRKIVDYVEKRFRESPKVVWIYVDHGIGNGEPINKCLNICEEDLILLLEDDSYIYKKGAVDGCFKRIENGECDALGSPRGSCDNELYNIAMLRFKNPQGYYGDIGPNFWPAFFFVKRKDLLRTDQNFASKTFPAGAWVKELGWAPTVDQCSDTFVWASIQLRAMGLRFCYVPQCKIYPEHTSLRDLDPFGWTHSGSLSSGWSGRLLRGHFSPDKLSHSAEFLEHARRVAFWTMAANLEDYEEIAEFKKEYLRGIEGVINQYGLDRERIAERINGFKMI